MAAPRDQEDGWRSERRLLASWCGIGGANARQNLAGAVAGSSHSRRPAPWPAQPRGCSDTQRPWWEVQALFAPLLVKGRRPSRFPLVVTSGHPGERRPRSADCPAGPLSSPPPASSLQAPERWEILQAAVSGRAGRGAAPALGCDLEQFHFWIPPGCDGRVPGWGWRGDTRAGRGPVLGTPSEGWFLLLGVLHLTPPPRPFSISLWVPLRCPPELSLLPSCHRLRGGCRPPERPRAAWAAEGASCEAAGRGVRLRAAETPSCFSEVQLPLPSHPPQLPPRTAPHPCPPLPSLSFPLSGTPNLGIWCLGSRRIKTRS